VTKRARRLFVSTGALGCLSLALILAAQAAAAATSTESARKRRTALGSVDRELAVAPAAWLTLRPVWLPPGAAEKPPAAARLEAQTLLIESPMAAPTPPPSNPLRRGGHGTRSSAIPKYLPPFTGPASPIR
jgi:hypothetical protein